MTRKIALSELEQHSTNQDCWISVHGVVMDITPFLNEHPGGPDVIVSVSGRDCTQEFEDVGHTDSARGMGNKYIIGSLNGLAESQELRIPTVDEVHASNEQSEKHGVWNLATGFAVTLAVAAFAYHMYVNMK
jgi:cytochrome b involved in lipid metabolism